MSSSTRSKQKSASCANSSERPKDHEKHLKTVIIPRPHLHANNVTILCRHKGTLTGPARPASCMFTLLITLTLST